MNIYTVGINEEYTISMVKNACGEFKTLTDDQAMKICELLAEYKCDRTSSEEIESLQDENSELERELEDAQDELEYTTRKNWKLQEKIDQLEKEIKELKHASNK